MTVSVIQSLVTVHACLVSLAPPATSHVQSGISDLNACSHVTVLVGHCVILQQVLVSVSWATEDCDAKKRVWTATLVLIANRSASVRMVSNVTRHLEYAIVVRVGQVSGVRLCANQESLVSTAHIRVNVTTVRRVIQ